MCVLVRTDPGTVYLLVNKRLSNSQYQSVKFFNVLCTPLFNSTTFMLSFVCTGLCVLYVRLIDLTCTNLITYIIFYMNRLSQSNLHSIIQILQSPIQFFKLYVDSLKVVLDWISTPSLYKYIPLDCVLTPPLCLIDSFLPGQLFRTNLLTNRYYDFFYFCLGIEVEYNF